MKLLLLDSYEPAAVAELRAALMDDWELEMIAPGTPAARLAAALAEAEAAVTQSWSAQTPPAPRLRLLQLPGAGYDAIDLTAVPPGAAVCNVYEHEIGIAEYLVAAMLEWEIRLSRMHAQLREGRWVDGFALGAPLHGELHGKRVGFIGYGRIARAAAARLAPFGVEIWARTRSPSTGDQQARNIAGMEDLPEMLAACDYIAVTCPLNDGTRGLIDRAALARMRKDAVILNVGRGPIIDEDALFDACRERTIGGAIIDTWYRYPDEADGQDQICRPSRHPFESLDNVLMTPHASGWSAGLLSRRFAVVADNLNRLTRGEPLRNQIRAPAG